jgi:methylglutaconyl-CoA hydratase
MFHEISNDESVKVVVLTGDGRSFCSGADLNWMKSMVNYSEEDNFDDSRKLYTMFNTINTCQKPIIGKINGHALGGGVGLVSVCDYVITHEKAKFGFTEVRLGLIPAVISKFCISKIGESHARAWFLSGEMFSAGHAEKIGLVHEVTSLEKFEDRFNEVVQSHLLAGPESSVKAKELIQNIMNLPSEEIEEFTCKAIASRRVSDEGQEGMNALLMKRKARWVKND